MTLIKLERCYGVSYVADIAAFDMDSLAEKPAPFKRSAVVVHHFVIIDPIRHKPSQIGSWRQWNSTPATKCLGSAEPAHSQRSDNTSNNLVLGCLPPTYPVDGHIQRERSRNYPGRQSDQMGPVTIYPSRDRTAHSLLT